MNLCAFEKPSRYIDREINSFRKEAPVKVALAFPDIYDVGMSHLGLKILHMIINNLPYASAERVFSPWNDMEAEMKAKGVPLSSLESKRPLRDFDIVGFSLQYELSYTTVLNMLSMGGIPLRAGERTRPDPLIIAGGPCTVNPAPMSPFIDAFLIGDGESAIIDILHVFQLWKSEGDGKRESLFEGLSEIAGVYVPAIHGSNPSLYAVKRRYVASLDDSPYPTSPVVPYTSIVHDRITIELSRGCTRGCRFCQAGMIYRPLRGRSPRRVVEIAEESLKNTGYEEISLTSLSAGDYPYLLPLAKELNKRFSRKVVSLSLPSLRVGAVSQDVLKEIKTVRKTGFTMAPEAATERLRMVINKDFGEEDYERALHSLFAEGWEGIKLYFMVGLPTETEGDVEAIPEMAFKAIKIAKKYTRRYVNVNVGISPFVPKPHTPMQWCGQEGIDTITAKMEYLRNSLTRKKMAYKGHNAQMSLLEAVFARGDERLSDFIEKAWSAGCRLDAWTESFDFGKWLSAAEKTGIDIHGYAGRRYAREDALPWDGIEIGIRKDFLWKELQKALSGEKTPDCQDTCYGCGLACGDRDQGEEGSKEIVRADEKKVIPSRGPASAPPFQKVKVRVCFSKTGDLRHLSHRELMTAFIRALRRADIPLAYSQGFHPSPRVSFGPPLNVGVSGLREYFDMEIMPTPAFSDIENVLNSRLPEGLKIEEARLIPLDAPSLDSFISRYEYEIICPDSRRIEDFLGKDRVFIGRERPDGRKREIDARKMVEEAWIIDDHTVRLFAVDTEDAKVRLGEILEAVFHVRPEDLMVTRVDMQGWREGWVTPFEGLYGAKGKVQKEKSGCEEGFNLAV